MVTIVTNKLNEQMLLERSVGFCKIKGRQYGHGWNLPFKGLNLCLIIQAIAMKSQIVSTPLLPMQKFYDCELSLLLNELMSDSFFCKDNINSHSFPPNFISLCPKNWLQSYEGLIFYTMSPHLERRHHYLKNWK